MYGISNGQQKGNGGGGSANYTKIESTIPTSAWVSSAPSWIGQNALTWSKTGKIYYTQVDTEELGLSSSGTYSAVLTIDGTDYVDEYSEAGVMDGMSIYIAYFNNYSVTLQIADHCSGFDEQGDWVPGNGYNVSVVVGDTAPSSVIIKSFSAVGGISAIISNSAIKVNSAVTMYIDYNGKIKAAGKADGSITLTADSIPTISIPYSIEIVGTDTEGLFELVNGYIPDVPQIPASLPQTTSNFIKVSISPSQWTKSTHTDGLDYYYSDFNVENMYANKDALFRVNYAGYIEIEQKASSGNGVATMRVTVRKLLTADLYIYYRLGQISGFGYYGTNITVVNEFSGYITDKPDHLYLTDTATGTLYEVTVANGTISLVAQSST